MTANFDIPYGYNQDGTFPGYPHDRHLITFGPTRSGKGATVIVQALLRVHHSVICIDPKGQNTAITARQRRALGQSVYILNPFDELGLGTSHFNPLSHLDIAHPNAFADVGALSEALILPAHGDQFFVDSARDLVKALMLNLLERRSKGALATLPEMRRLLTIPRHANPEQDQFLTEVLFHLVHSAYPFIKQPANRFIENNRTTQSILAVAIAQTSFLDDPLVAKVLSKSDFTIQQLKDKPTTVYVILPSRYMDSYARFFRLMLTSAIDQLTTKPGGHRTLIICDEFAALQNLPAITKAFGLAAGYNVQIWPFLQDIPQLKTIYEDRWESFIANAGLLQFFTPADMTTAQYISDRAGGQMTDSTSTSYSPWLRIPKSIGVSPSRIPLLPPEFTMNMPKTDQVVFFGGTHSAVTAIKRESYWNIPRLKGLYDPDPFHT